MSRARTHVRLAGDDPEVAASVRRRWATFHRLGFPLPARPLRPLAFATVTSERPATRDELVERIEAT